MYTESITANTPAEPLRVAINARLVSGKSGGVESVVIGLAHGLSQLDGADEYVFLTYEGHDSWIRRHVSGPCRILAVPYPGERWAAAREFVNQRTPRLANGARSARRTWRWIRKREVLATPASDGTIEAAGVDLVHFPFQSGFLTDLPSIYHPHDLQHLHLPQFFTPEQYRGREMRYRALCADSAMVAVASRWVRNDVITSYGLPDDRVVVVPLAPPVDAYHRPSADEMAKTRDRFGIPANFILYPAATWPHKNHLRLLEALAALKERGAEVPLVCTGMRTGYFRVIERRIRQLGLGESVEFLGVVSPEELTSLYAMATAVVIPTEFEAASFPIWEAFRLGTPVACSAITSLPDQVGDAAVLFDPHDVVGIAAAIESLWTDTSLRRELVERGRRQVEQFDWVTTARSFRAHYRRIAGRRLDEDDLAILASLPAI